MVAPTVAALVDAAAVAAVATALVVAAVVAAGSEKEAAHRLGLSHSTVKHHLANARSRVGATTTAQLVWILAERLAGPGNLARPDD
jgi:DNA-binding CsgD family transcriptional regulator